MSYKTVKAWLTKHVHTTITPDRLDDFNEMFSFLQNHPNWSNWTNQIPEYFRITRSPKKKALQVYVKFTDVKKERIVSWVDCTDKYNPNRNNLQNQLKQAMRSAISPQIVNWRTFNNPQKCALCDSWDNIEVDHYPCKFYQIKNDFLNDTEIIPPTSFRWDGNRYQFNTSDFIFSNIWSNFHLMRATYRYLCATCNQKTNKS